MPKIVRIIKVVDTREYEEGPDDRFHPIPGSGQQNQCARCGRMHEVHALVKLDNDEVITVGTGCAARESSEIAARFKEADSVAKRLARLNAEEAAFRKHLADWERAWSEVVALPVPELREEAGKSAGFGDDRVVYRIGNEGLAIAFSRCLSEPGYRAERVRCATDGWRAARMQERGQARWRPSSPKDFTKRRDQLEAALRKLAA